MLMTLRTVVLLLCGLLFGGDAFAQDPIRIDRPKEGALVEIDIEVAGVATPGATVEVWVDRVFIVDTIAEPDGWYVARLKRPPNATEKSRIFVHELNPAGQRTSSAVVRVTWSEEPVAEQPVVPPPAVAVDGVPEPEQLSGELTETPVVTADAVDAEAPQPSYRSGRIAVESLVSVVAGITGAVFGLLIGTAVGQPDSGERIAATVMLGSLSGAMASAGAVYGVGYAMKGNGSFLWTTFGALGGAVLVVATKLALDKPGALVVPVAIVAFGLPVLAYELTSDTNRDDVRPAQPLTPTVGVTREGRPSFGFSLQW